MGLHIYIHTLNATYGREGGGRGVHNMEEKQKTKIKRTSQGFGEEHFYRRYLQIHCRCFFFVCVLSRLQADVRLPFVQVVADRGGANT